MYLSKEITLQYEITLKCSQLQYEITLKCSQLQYEIDNYKVRLEQMCMN